MPRRSRPTLIESLASLTERHGSTVWFAGAAAAYADGWKRSREQDLMDPYETWEAPRWFLRGYRDGLCARTYHGCNL